MTLKKSKINNYFIKNVIVRTWREGTCTAIAFPVTDAQPKNFTPSHSLPMIFCKPLAVKR